MSVARALLNRRLMKRPFLLSLLTFAGLAASSGAARAETAPPLPACFFTTAPSPDGTVPANLPALVLLDQSYAGTVPSNIRPTFSGDELAAPKVTADSRMAGAYLLTLDPALTAQTSYTVNYSFDCNYKAGGPAPHPQGSGSMSFSTVANVALPTAAGTLAAGTPNESDFATSITLTPSAELAAYLPVTLFDVSVGGAAWAQIPYGGARVSGGTVELDLSAVSIYSKGVTAAGATSLCAQTKAASVTVHLSVTAHVAGAAADPSPLEVDASVLCAENQPPPGLDGGGDAGDGGSLDASVPGDAGTTDAGPSDAGPDDPGATSQAHVAQGGGGCQVGSGGDAASLFGGLGMAIAALAGRARRRRRA